MSFDWGSIKSLLLFFGPILLPKVIGYYRALSTSHDRHSIQPVPPAISGALLLIFTTTIYFFVQALPYFSPEEIFSLTKSRLRTPNDVLFTRLSTVRGFSLTKSDEILKSKFSSLEARLLYFQYGPSALVDCSFCETNDPKSYFYFSLPILLFPHLLNMTVLGISTSSFFTRKDGSVWRTQASIATLVVGALDLYLAATYSFRKNSSAARLENIDFFFWRSRTYRFLTLAVLDGLFGWILYLSTTRRAFPQQPLLKFRIESLSNALENVRSKLSATAVLQNTIVRDSDLRTFNQQYWTNEVKLSREVMEEREVIECFNYALEKRINMNRIEQDAQSYAKDVLKPFHKHLDKDNTI